MHMTIDVFTKNLEPVLSPCDGEIYAEPRSKVTYIICSEQGRHKQNLEANLYHYNPDSATLIKKPMLILSALSLLGFLSYKGRIN